MGRRHLVCVRIGLHTFHLRGITESRVREFEGRGVILGDATVTITPVDLRGREVPHYELVYHRDRHHAAAGGSEPRPRIA